MTQEEFEHQAAGLRRKAMATGRSHGLGDADADDVAQDTLMRLWQMRGSIGDGAHAEALATVVARRLAVDLLRRSGRTLTGIKHDVPHAAQPGADTALEEAEAGGWLLAKLEQLPPTEYQVLYMRQVERRPRGEIARILGIAETSVSTLLARARRRLLEEIKRRNGR